MGLGEGDDRARLKRHHGDVHVVAHVGRIDEARRRPPAFGAGHRRRRNVLFVGEEGLRHINAIDGFVGLADPVEAHSCTAFVANRPSAGRRQEGKAAGTHHVGLAADGHAEFALDHEQAALGTFIGFRPVAAAAGCDLNDILRKRLGKA